MWRRLSGLTSATSSIYGLSEARSNHSETSSRSTAGANGLKLSRYLTFRLRFFCISGERGSPRIERAPSERGPELHAALKPADGLLRGQGLCRGLDHRLFAQHHKTG